MEGDELIRAAVDLVRAELRRTPDGITNAEMAERTNLNLQISKQNGYITWTILQHLLENREIVKEGRLYKLQGK